MYEWLKALHILMAVVWVGGGVATQVLATRLRKADPSTMVRTALQFEWMGTHIYLPASLVMLGAGLWMVLGFELWEFSDAWVALGLAGFAATIVTGTAFLGPQIKKIHALAEQKGLDDPSVVDALGRLFVISRIDLVVLLLVVVDMAVKPTF